tara:strand:+ start:1021 stop:1734 length:714 start_codon:yes stop_codon:yes gene_type:complete
MKNRSNKNFKILHKQNEVEIIIKKNKLSRSYKLTFDKKSLSGLVSIPRHISFSEGFSFAQENSNWLVEQYNEMMPLIKIENGRQIYFEGKKRKLIYLDDKKSNIELCDKSIIISNNKNKHQEIFYKWIKKRISEKAKLTVINFSKVINVKIRNIKLSNSFSYWGSCNSNNDISINWRLAFSPPAVLEYIIAHEMSHLVEFNHSKRFWALVDKLVSKRKNKENWLKKNGNYLYRVRFN